MNDRVGCFFRSLREVVWCTVGLAVFYFGLNTPIILINKFMITGYPIKAGAFIFPVIVLIIGALILRSFIKKDNKWKYSLGASLILFSLFPIVASSGMGRFVVATGKSGVEAKVIQAVSKTHLIIGLVTLVFAVISIAGTMIQTRKIS